MERIGRVGSILRPVRLLGSEPPTLRLRASGAALTVHGATIRRTDDRDVTILIVTPAARGARHGNRVTALRWAAHLRALGHRVRIAERWSGAPCDLLIALHATRSAPSVARLHAEHPQTPIVVALTGTDVYQDRLASDAARASLAAARRIVVLQASALGALPPGDRARTRVIVQSARAAVPWPATPGTFQACVLAHLREVKDPFLAATATRLLGPESRVRVVHLGRALDPGSAERARRETAENPRYDWRGERPRGEALRTLAGSQALLVTSRLEGGANVVSEAVAAGVPVLSTRIDGTIGLLGPDYPGYFPVEDAGALAALLSRLETDAGFRAALQAHIDQVRPLVEPGRERAAWEALLRELPRSRSP